MITFGMMLCCLIANAQLSEEKIVNYTRYLLYVPQQKPPSGKYPLLLFLHGSAERGSDLNLLKRTGPFIFADTAKNFPFILVAPQCDPDRDWDTQNLLTLIDSLESRLDIDKSKIYVTGYSMGGFGTWKLAQAAPLRFAAIAPICGGGDSSRICAIRNMSVWAFHGEKDNAVPYVESERMVKGLRSLESDVKFTLYPDLEHDSWSITYANPELYHWLFSKKRVDSIQIDPSLLKNYTGTYKYSDNENMIVSLSHDSLFVKSTVSGNNLLLIPFKKNKFRIPGGFSGDGEVYFETDNAGKVTGLSIGPCDHTLCRKIK